MEVLPQATAEAQRLLQAFVSSMAGSTDLGSSRPDADKRVDAAIILMYSAGLFVMNWGLRFLLAAPTGKVMLKGLIADPKAPRRAYDNKVVKYSQSYMEAVFYGAFSVMGFLTMKSQPWLWPSSNWWIGFADAGAPHALMRDDLRCYYLLYTGRYIQSVVSVLLEPKRKDFVEMMLHHVVTVAVCSVSYWYGWNRVGVVVMFVLDPADVPLHLAKLSKYCSDVGDSATALSAKVWGQIADVFFIIFAVLFLVMRLVIYPYVCWSAHVESTRYFPKGPPEWLCVALLETLLLLQAYWFFLIIKVAIRLAQSGGVEDVRSSDEEDEVAPQKNGQNGAASKKTD